MRLDARALRAPKRAVHVLGQPVADLVLQAVGHVSNSLIMRIAL